MFDGEFFITIYYSTPIILLQLMVCILLWRLTRDTRTWGLLVTGSLFSLSARYIILQPMGLPVWIDDVLRAISISLNTVGFFSLYFLLKKLIQKSDKRKIF